MLKEFKQFALKGNMIDLAVGIIIGGAFSNLVNTLVNYIFMPLLSLITNRINFTDWFFALDGEKYKTLKEVPESVPVLQYGAFISGAINFLLMAFVVFLIVKWLNKLKKPTPAAEPTTKKCPYCLTEINHQASKCPNCTSNLS